MIVSDNAKVFKGKDTRDFLRDRGVKWEFTTPRAPWKGGVWERMIRIVKRCLKKVLGKTSLSYEELETVLTEVELIVNNRPLTYIDSDSLEDSFLMVLQLALKWTVKLFAVDFCTDGRWCEIFVANGKLSI